jgi:anti-sigma regulatory factor (Ser/Thr protein kinase)
MSQDMSSGGGGFLLSATERDFELAGGPYAATAARLALDNLDTELDPVLAQDLRLLVTEAVKNSVQHAGVGPEDSIGLKIAVGTELVRIEVSDEGPGFEPDASRPDEDEVSGWGLFLIDQLADRWGVVHEGGTTVWFEVTRAASRPSRADAAA